MRLRTLALALALSFGVTGMAEAAARPKVQRFKSPKFKKTKIRKTQRYKQSKASKVKTRKAPKRAYR